MDRLSLSFPADSFTEDPTAWSTATVKFPGTPQAAETRGAVVQVDEDVTAFVGVSQVRTGEWWGKVEFNPSRVIDPGGYGLAPVVALPSAVERVMAKATELVQPRCEVPEMRVKRIDVARDFSTDRADFFVRGLGPVHRPWARKNGVYFDPAKKGAQTLMVGSGAGMVRLYDKHAETEGKAPPGTLRWEVEARSGWAKQYAEVKALADVSASSIENLARNRWEWSAMGVEVSATDRIIEQVQRSGLTAAKQRSFLGYLLLSSRGISSPLSNDTASEFRRLVRTLGITLTDDTDTDALGFVGRLDWDTGREVLHAA